MQSAGGDVRCVLLGFKSLQEDVSPCSTSISSIQSTPPAHGVPIIPQASESYPLNTSQLSGSLHCPWLSKWNVPVSYPSSPSMTYPWQHLVSSGSGEQEEEEDRFSSHSCPWGSFHSATEVSGSFFLPREGSFALPIATSRPAERVEGGAAGPLPLSHP